MVIAPAQRLIYIRIMITLVGNLIEENIVKAARYYIHEYACKEKLSAEVPFIHNGKKRKVEFLWMAEQWVYVGLSRK